MISGMLFLFSEKIFKIRKLNPVTIRKYKATRIAIHNKGMIKAENFER